MRVLEVDEVRGPYGGVRAIVRGPRHSCAVLDDGSVRCWGANDKGQLGLPKVMLLALGVSHTCALLDDETVRIAAGADHTCALTHDWRVLCWGRGTDRALHASPSHDVCFGIDSRIVCTRSPTPVPALPGVGHLMLGEDVTCVFPHDGTSRCWKRDDD